MHAMWAHAFHILRGRGADQTNTGVHAYNTIMECVHACTIVDHHIGLAQAFFRPFIRSTFASHAMLVPAER